VNRRRRIHLEAAQPAYLVAVALFTVLVIRNPGGASVGTRLLIWSLGAVFLLLRAWPWKD